MKYAPVLIVWKDITTKSGWVTQDEVDEFIMDENENTVYQVGFLYEEDDNQVCLLNSFFEEQDLLGDVTKIPKQCITKITKL